MTTINCNTLLTGIAVFLPVPECLLRAEKLVHNKPVGNKQLKDTEIIPQKHSADGMLLVKLGNFRNQTATELRNKVLFNDNLLRLKCSEES